MKKTVAGEIAKTYKTGSASSDICNLISEETIHLQKSGAVRFVFSDGSHLECDKNNQLREVLQ